MNDATGLHVYWMGITHLGMGRMPAQVVIVAIHAIQVAVIADVSV